MFFESRTGVITPHEMHQFVGAFLDSEDEMEASGPGRNRITRIKRLAGESSTHRIVVSQVEQRRVRGLAMTKLGKLVLKPLLPRDYSGMFLEIADKKDPARSMEAQLEPATPEGRLRIVAGDYGDNKTPLDIHEPTARDTADINFALVNFAMESNSEA
jgi:hypothetical protein